MSTTMRNVVFWGGASLIFAFLLFCGINLGIHDPGDSSAGISPRTWPRIVAAVLMLSGLYMTWESWVHHKKVRAHTAKLDETDIGVAYSTKDLLVTLVIFAAYYAGMHLLGIAASSLLAFLLLTRLSGERRMPLMLAIGAAMAVGLYYFFLHVAYIPMPPGPFGGLI